MQQNCIGWRQLFNGRFSKEWARIQNNHYSGARLPDPDRSSKRRTGNRWQVQSITLIWKNGTLLGQIETRHFMVIMLQPDKQPSTKKSANNSPPFMTVALLEPRVETLLQETQEQHEAHTVSSIQNWLRTNMSIFRDSWKRAAQQATQGVWPLRWYLPPSGRGWIHNDYMLDEGWSSAG